jgi:hypothetical protein
MRITPEISEATIVLIGSFNPRIFRPEWFASTGIIGGGDATSATIEVIHSEIASFSLDWLTVRVQRDRFSVETIAPPFVRARDLVMRTFREFLMHTPVSKIGFNRLVHFNVSSFEIRDRVGTLLAPKEPWGEWASKMKGESGRRETTGGLKSLTMTQIERDDGYSGSIAATVEPSSRLIDRGIYMNVNDHYELGDPEKILGNDQAMAVLETHWEESMRRAEWIIDQIMGLALDLST